MINKLETKMYKLTILTKEEKAGLEEYGTRVQCSDGVIPNVYGIWNKETQVYEHYCANMPQALSIMTTLQQGYEQEIEAYEKKKADLRSV